MNSNFFNFLGLRNVDAGILFVGLFVFCIILLILNITAFAQITKFKRKYTKFMLGKDGANLENDPLVIRAASTSRGTGDGRRVVPMPPVSRFLCHHLFKRAVCEPRHKPPSVSSSSSVSPSVSVSSAPSSASSVPSP